jgi:radical SAM superfamily enzyme YgiQ (UPF0313 family)
MRGRRVALLCIEPTIVGGEYAPFSFGVRRVQAALMADAALGADVHLVESRSRDADDWVDKVEAIDPDVVGLSTFVWSFPTWVDVAKRLKARRPDRTIVMGGPSARTAMFALEPFRGSERFVDALATGDGEGVLGSVLNLSERDPVGLRGIAGLAIPGALGWTQTPRSPVESLDGLASPMRMGILPRGRTVCLETYRGCPMSCAFCAWGDLESPKKVFSSEYLAAELSAMRQARTPNVQIVDAALNLNSRAFRNLAAAERASRCFAGTKLYVCVYPSHLADEHMEFLASIRRPRIDLGLQSFSPAALSAMDRPFQESRFDRVVEQLARVADIEVEIILGLPGDTPEGFRATLARARSLPAMVRIFHCLVLPDALMTRAPPGVEMDFDPVTLAMRACTGWSAEALATEARRLTEEVERAGGESDGDTWQFPGPGDRASSGRRAGEAVDARTHAALAAAVLRGSGGAWTLAHAARSERGVVAEVAADDGPLLLDVRPAHAGAPAYRSLDGVSFAYRLDARRERAPALRVLDGVVDALAASVKPLLPGTATLTAKATTTATANGAPFVGVRIDRMRALLDEARAHDGVHDGATRAMQDAVLARFERDRWRAGDALEPSVSAGPDGVCAYRFSYAGGAGLRSFCEPLGEAIVQAAARVARAARNPCVAQPLFGYANDIQARRAKLYLQFRDGSDGEARALACSVTGASPSAVGAIEGALHLLGLDLGERGVVAAKLYFARRDVAPRDLGCADLGVLPEALVVHSLRAPSDPLVPVAVDFALADAATSWPALAETLAADHPAAVATVESIADRFRIAVRRVSLFPRSAGRLNVYYVLDERQAS